MTSDAMKLEILRDLARQLLHEAAWEKQHEAVCGRRCDHVLVYRAYKALEPEDLPRFIQNRLLEDAPAPLVEDNLSSETDSSVIAS